MKQVKMLCVGLLCVLLVGGGIFVGANWNRWFAKAKISPASQPVDQNARDWTGKKDSYTGKKNTNTIDIPGFGVMNLKANTTKQSVNLYNPKQNTCYFKLTLLLADGTKLWQSKLLEPGKAIYEIDMKQALKVGVYRHAILKYECFALDEKQTPLNGSEIKVDLHVMN